MGEDVITLISHKYSLIEGLLVKVEAGSSYSYWQAREKRKLSVLFPRIFVKVKDDQVRNQLSQQISLKENHIKN